MNRRRNFLIGGLAAICSAAIVYGLYVLQIKQIALQQTIQVTMPKDFIRAGVVLTSDMLVSKPIYAASYTSAMAREPADLLGQETLVPLGKDEPILRWKLDRLHLLPGAHQATFQIPKEYVLSISSGIRAGDRVLLYASSSERERSIKLFDEEITVASVKSSANVEIDNPKSSNLLSKAEGDEEKMYISRLEANAPIDHVDLNLSEEQWLTIDRLCSGKKSKLVIAFTAVSIREP